MSGVELLPGCDTEGQQHFTLPSRVRVVDTAPAIRRAPNQTATLVALARRGWIYWIVEEENGWGLLRDYAGNRDGWLRLCHTKLA